MRADKYMMAKAWMKQDKAPREEAIGTWNKLEAEFNEERKQMLKILFNTRKRKNLKQTFTFGTE